MVEQIIVLSLIPKSIPRQINISQYDVGSRTLIFSVPEASGTATIESLTFEEPCTISGTEVSVTVTESMTAESGKIKCCLKFVDGNAVLRSENFYLVVEKKGVSA